MGPGITPSKHPPPDQDQLQHMLMILRLQVLNSWGKKSKSFTFENGDAKTQIDFNYYAGRSGGSGGAEGQSSLRVSCT